VKWAKTDPKAQPGPLFKLYKPVTYLLAGLLTQTKYKPQHSIAFIHHQVAEKQEKMKRKKIHI